MSRSKITTNIRRGPALLATLLLSALALGVAAPQAGAVAALYSEVAEEMAEEYSEAFCRQDKPDCKWGAGARCGQEGKFQVTCWAAIDYETADDSEYWSCKRHIRYTAEREPYWKHKRVIKHRQFLGPWICEPHHKVKDY